MASIGDLLSPALIVVAGVVLYGWNRRNGR
jgi:hypothetical protein